LFSQCSDGIFQFAIAGIAFFTPEEQTSAAEAAVAFAVLLLPYSVLGPFTGVFIDRWSRRQILMIVPFVRGLLLLLAATLVAAETPHGYFYACALAVLGVNRFFLSALGASLPHVVPADRLMMANAVTPTSGTVATFLGAGLGFALRLVLGGDAAGTAWLLVVTAVTFLFTAVLAARMERTLLGPTDDPARPQAREELRNIVTGLADGARYVAHRRQAAATLGALAAHRFCYGVSIVMAVMLYRFYFTQDADAGLTQLSGALGTSGIGYFAAAFVTPWGTSRFRVQTWVTMMLVAAGTLELALCAGFHEWGFLIAGFVLGLTGQSVKICADTVIQRDVADAYLGRVFAIYDMLFNVVFVAAAAVTALFLPANGRSYLALAIATAGYLLGAAAYRLAASSETGPRLRPAP
jgi:MFS family permease